MGPLRRQRLDRIPDLQRSLAMPDQKLERRFAIGQEGMLHVRRTGAMTKDGRAMHGLRVGS